MIVLLYPFLRLYFIRNLIHDICGKARFTFHYILLKVFHNVCSQVIYKLITLPQCIKIFFVIEVFNKDNIHDVFNIPRLKSWALKKHQEYYCHIVISSSDNAHKRV